jgi:hypothetical protein
MDWLHFWRSGFTSEGTGIIVCRPMSDSEKIGPPGAVKKFAILRQQHAKLHVEREHMVVNVKRNIMASFQRTLGAHDHALKKAEWEVGRLKRELELVRGSAQEGELDYERVAGALEAEFNPREKELEAVPGQIEWANKRLNGLMTMEQTTAFQARYRRLAERLHPDLRFGQSVTAGNLWERVRGCYVTGDATELEAIELIVEDLPLESVETQPAAEIEERVARLKKANEAMINEISAMRQQWPFPLASKLPDEAWLKGQREEYERKTMLLVKERQVLTEELNRILDARPSDRE